MDAEIFADISVVQGFQRDVAGGTVWWSVQVWQWSVTDDLGDAVEETLNLQVLKQEPCWVFPLKIERDWMSQT